MLSGQNETQNQSSSQIPPKTTIDVKSKNGSPKDSSSDLNSIRITPDQDLYTALNERKMLFPSSTIGTHLVKEGEIGLCLKNGKPIFLAPGRHTFLSPYTNYLGSVSIQEKEIKLGSVQIITVAEGEIGLSIKNGKNIILDPGQYILQSPHYFSKTAKANQHFIELGTHRRITVPVGHVAIAYDNGKQIIISPNDTKAGPYITDSTAFSFDPAEGFQPTQRQSIELDQLMVNTKEFLPIKIEGLLTYQISDPKIAFLATKDVHGAIKRRAEATLTSVFAQLSIDEIAIGLSTEHATSLKGKHALQDNFIHKATELFLQELRDAVNQWGVTVETLNIEKMDFVNKAYADALRGRAQKRMETDTNLANIDSKNAVLFKEAQAQSQRQIIEAEAQAEVIKKIADANLYAAQKDAEAGKILMEVPLAADLARAKAQAKIAKEMGNNTIYMPHNLSLDTFGIAHSRGQMFFSPQRDSSPQRNSLQLINRPENKPLANDAQNNLRL